MPDRSIGRALKRLLRRGSFNVALPRASALVEETSSWAPAQEPAARLCAELYRARRYRRPLSLVVLTAEPRPPSTVEAGERTWPASRSGAGSTRVSAPISDRRAEAALGETPILLETRLPHLLSLLAASLLSETLRATDTVSYQAAQNRFVIGFPESDAGQTLTALSRVTSLLADRLGVEVRTGMARFPEDGPTLEELVARAQGAWAEGREPAVTVATPRLVSSHFPDGRPEPSGALG